MKQNLGKLDRIFRFVIGLWFLGPWAPVFSATWANNLVIFVGVVALLESLFAFCPLHDMIRVNNKSQ